MHHRLRRDRSVPNIEADSGPARMGRQKMDATCQPFLAACVRVDEHGERPYWKGIPNDLLRRMF